MVNVKVYFRSYNDAEEGYIWVSLYVNREKVHFSTKVACVEKFFDAKNCRIRSGDKLSKDKNLIIESVLSRINNVLVK